MLTATQLLSVCVEMIPLEIGNDNEYTVYETSVRAKEDNLQNLRVRITGVYTGHGRTKDATVGKRRYYFGRL